MQTQEDKFVGSVKAYIFAKLPNARFTLADYTIALSYYGKMNAEEVAAHFIGVEQS